MTFEIFEMGPSVYVPIIIFSLIITLAAYSMIPLIYAGVRKKDVSESEYKRTCYIYNFIICILFFVITDGEKMNIAPYLLWTTIFCGIGKRILFKRRVLNNLLKETSYDGENGIYIKDSTDIESVDKIGNECMQNSQIDFWKMKRDTEYANGVEDSHEINVSQKWFQSDPSLQARMYRKRFIIWICILIPMAVILLGINVYQYMYTKDIEETSIFYQDWVQSLIDEGLEREFDMIVLEDDNSELQEKVNMMEDAYDFYNEYAVIVSEDSNYYHSYGCDSCDLSAFWIYNIEAALDYGYEPCPHCQ